LEVRSRGERIGGGEDGERVGGGEDVELRGGRRRKGVTFIQ